MKAEQALSSIEPILHRHKLAAINSLDPLPYSVAAITRPKHRGIFQDNFARETASLVKIEVQRVTC